MERPKRVIKSTRNYDDFYYPVSKKKKIENEAKKQKNKNPNQDRKKSKHPSVSSIPNQPSSQPLNLNQATTTSLTPVPSPKSPAKNLEKNHRQRKAAETQTTQKTTRNLNEILNELYTNPDFPSAYGGQLKKFIMSKDSISKHRQRRKIFKRRKVKI